MENWLLYSHASTLNIETMNTSQIENGLLAKFEKSRSVFWQDDEGEFSAVLNDLALEGIVVLKFNIIAQVLDWLERCGQIFRG